MICTEKWKDRQNGWKERVSFVFIHQILFSFNHNRLVAEGLPGIKRTISCSCFWSSVVESWCPFLSLSCSLLSPSKKQLRTPANWCLHHPSILLIHPLWIMMSLFLPLRVMRTEMEREMMLMVFLVSNSRKCTVTFNSIRLSHSLSNEGSLLLLLMLLAFYCLYQRAFSLSLAIFGSQNQRCT